MIAFVNRRWWVFALGIGLAAVAACGAAKGLYEDETPTTGQPVCGELTATTVDCEGQ